MNGSEPGSALTTAWRRLQDMGQELRQQAQQPYRPQFVTLSQVIATLDTGGARPRRCPAASVLDWQRYVLDPSQRLSSRAIRYLCWEPAVALDARFQSSLDAELSTLSATALQGLVWCCHGCWSPTFATSALAQRVRQRLTAYAGENLLVQHWRQHAAVVLGPEGPRDLGRALIAARMPLAVFCHTWGIDQRSPYAIAMLRQAMTHCLQEMHGDASLSAYLLTTLLPWSGWTGNDFRTATAATVLHPVISATPGLPEQVMHFVLADARLGDPRLPSHLPTWAEMPANVRQQLLPWLTSADMHFFFDHVLPASKDQAERKVFWLRYASRVLRSRPLLHATDILRLQPVLRQHPASMGHFGRMHDTASGLILDLGALVVVQVSDLSEACYVYGKHSFAQLVPDFWQAQPFTGVTLLAPGHAATIPHHQTWEKDVGEIFAQYSIRATYTEAA